MSKYSKINEIYMGHLDAKDEINYGTLDFFLQCFVIPPNFDFDSLITGHQYIINGYKGVGKTALMFYLESLLLEKDSSTCTSFVLFNSFYNDIDKEKLDSAAKRLVQSISIDEKSMSEVTDFTSIWKLIIFKKMIEDHEQNSDNLFVQDDQWFEFEKLVKSIHIFNSTALKVFRLKKLKLVPNVISTGDIVPTIEIDLEHEIDKRTLSLFNEKMHKIESVFLSLSRTDIPYYIFIDELEAFYGKTDTFKRDLTMLRDLIFATKEINYWFILSNMKLSKIICSVRTEIVNSIYRFIPTKEVNKIFSGFECPINWNSNNTNTYNHPLFQVLLKRLQLTDSKKGVKYKNTMQIFSNWFAVDEEDKTVNHLLNNLWNKPRDIIRLINSLKFCDSSSSLIINNNILDKSIKLYSNKALEEISTELNALYSPDDINTIIGWFRGFKSPFSIEELNERISEFTTDNLVLEKFGLEKILEDLYRVGVIGNFNKYSNVHRYQHKGDDTILFDESWLITIHQGLNGSLSVTNAKKYLSNKVQKNRYYSSDKLDNSIIYQAIIKNANNSFVFIDISHNGNLFKGVIHVSNFVVGKYIDNLKEIVKIGDTIRVNIIEFDELHNNWKASKVIDTV